MEPCDTVHMSIESSTSQANRRPAVSTALATAAAASAGAGLVHAATAGTHNGDATLWWLFAAAAAAQLVWAALVLMRPTRLLIAVGIALNLGACAAWVLSRTVGLIGPLAEVEPVGIQDLLAAVLGGLAGGSALVALTRRNAFVARLNLGAAGLATALVLVLAVPAMAAEHTHGPSHEHAHNDGGTEHALDGDAANDGQGNDAHADAGHALASSTGATGGPIVSLDDPRLTKAEVQRATKLINETRAALATFPDEAALLDAGYISIGDGRAAGKFEHFVKHGYLADDKELNADAIESVVLQRQADGSKKVMSAMYILSSGTTMAEVPDVAGELTAWHDHQNLCWDPSGTRLAGIFVNGQCRPGGVRRGTSPMIHVWIEDTPCGPFSGIEGHGGNCEH